MNTFRQSLNKHIRSDYKCKSGDGGGHLHDEDSGHGLTMERYESLKGGSNAFLGLLNFKK